MQHRCHYLSLYCNNSTSFLISLVLYRDEIPCLELETCFFLFFFQLVRRYHLIKILQTIQPRLTPQFLAEYFSHHTIKHQKHIKTPLIYENHPKRNDDPITIPSPINASPEWIVWWSGTHPGGSWRGCISLANGCSGWWSWLEWNGSGGSGIISTSHGLVDVKWQRLNLYFTALTSKPKQYGLEDGHNNPRVPHSSSGGVIHPCAQFASRSHDPTVDINSWSLSGTLNIAT